MKKRSFETWEYEELELLFGLKQEDEHALLQEWLSRKYTLSDAIAVQIEDLRQLLAQNADAWNEDELKYCFISPFVALARLYSAHFKPFTQRNLSASFPELDMELHGRVEFMLAQGKQHPRKPFFFLHEYKQERKRDNDPKGQLLSSMLAAKALNESSEAEYGIYVVGRMWFFVVLHQQTYSVSQAFDASQEDIFAIFDALLAVKELAEARFGSCSAPQNKIFTRASNLRRV